ncbi:adenylyl-sulfate kinase [Spirosoma linguale]|uniref:Adenylyl-sulfate kinase n=1 Tax=Spirosoma linguale (strain ATCC 33905 / DSM 74 / LMG 10896 / Claus 1) TaxID=504472 RepID=D2QF03_SPILD|nr:adenylylsulfate kinase [Spirosoma linguale DSM 74]
MNTNAIVIWLTGLSGAGKTTIAQELVRQLSRQGVKACNLDGDQLRKGLNANLSYSEADRTENVRRTAEVAKLMADNGIVPIVSLISPTQAMRSLARSIVSDHRFVLVYVNAPLALCEQRDVKQLYKKARLGLVTQFTGIDAAYEAPHDYDIELLTAYQDVLTCTASIQQYITHAYSTIDQ